MVRRVPEVSRDASTRTGGRPDPAIPWYREHLGYARAPVPLPGVTMTAHTLGVGVSTLCGVALATVVDLADSFLV